MSNPDSWELIRIGFYFGLGFQSFGLILTVGTALFMSFFDRD